MHKKRGSKTILDDTTTANAQPQLFGPHQFHRHSGEASAHMALRNGTTPYHPGLASSVWSTGERVGINSQGVNFDQ